jgi:hypothetical protein
MSDSDAASLLDDLLPRLPLAIVLLALLVNTATALATEWTRHESLTQAQARLESPETQKALAEDQLIDQKLSDLIHAVAALAATDPEAQKIVSELHISVNGGTPAPPPR